MQVRIASSPGLLSPPPPPIRRSGDDASIHCNTVVPVCMLTCMHVIVTIHNVIIIIVVYHCMFILMNVVAGVDGEANFGGFLTRKVPKSINEVEEVCIA